VLASLYQILCLAATRATARVAPTIHDCAFLGVGVRYGDTSPRFVVELSSIKQLSLEVRVRASLEILMQKQNVMLFSTPWTAPPNRRKGI
jgi:hypothetical protein